MNVQVLRLAGGEDVVALVVGESAEGGLKIEKPMQIIVQQDKNNASQVQMGLVTFVPFIAKHAVLTLRPSQVLFSGEPTIDVLQLYMKATSGILTPSGPQIEMVGKHLLKG